MNYKASTCVLALMVGAIGLAQPALAADQAAAPAQTASTGSEEQNSGPEEILVTAQRRSERLQEVPVSVVALSQTTMTKLNLQNVQDLQFAAPGLTFARGINYSLVSLRGIGSFNTNPGLETSVATYIDGAYLERGFGAVYDVVDAASVQVLRGPQGTLWGRNATGGAIVITTADPTHELEGRVHAEVGSQGHYAGEGMLNIPLGETLAARFAVRYREDGGYINNPTIGHKMGWGKQFVARGKLAFTPSSDFSAIFEYQHDWDKASIDQNAQVLPAAFCAMCSGSAYTFPLPFYTSVVNNVNGGVGNTDKSDFYNLRLNYTAGDLTFSSTTAKRITDNFTAADFDFTDVTGGTLFGSQYFGFNLAQYSGSNAFTENLQVASNFSGAVNFTAGVDYLNDLSRARLPLSNVDSFANAFDANNGTTRTKSTSAYLELRVKPAPALTLTAGGRYTHDSRRAVDNLTNTVGNISFNSFTPRFVIAYDAGSTNLYASYNKGFKAGGYSGAPIAGNVYQPEKIDSYEVGAKFVSADRTLRANVAGFYYKYKDIQTTSVNQSNVGNIAGANNAGEATGKGFELDIDYQPSGWFHLFGGLSYVHANFDKFPNASVQYPSGTPSPATGPENLAGFALPLAPRWSGNLGATLRTPLMSGWKGELTAAARYSSQFDFTVGAGGPLRSDRQAGYTTAQLTGRIYPDSENFEINFFVNNLTDQKYDMYRFTTAPFGAYHIAARPRTYGVGITAKY